jgi:hypothetical protein
VPQLNEVAYSTTGINQKHRIMSKDKTSLQTQNQPSCLGAVSGSLSIKEVAAKYGEKVKCMFYDYDDSWKEKTMVVNASFLKDMEQGAIKDCH